MAGPEQLCQHAVEALGAGDEKKFQRWLKHPRWSPDSSAMEAVVVACLQQPRALALLQQLETSGVFMGARYGRVSVVGRAAEALQADVVDWLLDAGRPLPWDDFSGSPLCLVLEGLSKRPFTDGDAVEPAQRIAQAFYGHATRIQDVVGSTSFSRLARASEDPRSAEVWKAVVAGGWDLQDPSDDTRVFLAQVKDLEPGENRGLLLALEAARVYQRERLLNERMGPAAVPSTPRLRF